MGRGNYWWTGPYKGRLTGLGLLNIRCSAGDRRWGWRCKQARSWRGWSVLLRDKIPLVQGRGEKENFFFLNLKTLYNIQYPKQICSISVVLKFHWGEQLEGKCLKTLLGAGNNEKGWNIRNGNHWKFLVKSDRSEWIFFFFSKAM